MPDIIACPKHNKARQNISFYLHNIKNWIAHESSMNCYSNYNKEKAKQNHMHILWDVLCQQRKTTCLLSIRITFARARVSKSTTANMYITRARCESQLTGSGVEWAECSLTIGTDWWVQVFSLILDSSVGLLAVIQAAGDLVSETLGSNPAFSRGRQRVSFRFEYRLPVPEHRN